MPKMVGQDYGFDRPEVFSSLQVENPSFYRSRQASRHIDDGSGQMLYGCESVDVDSLIRKVLTIKDSRE